MGQTKEVCLGLGARRSEAAEKSLWMRLTKVSGGEQKLVGNISFREALDWDEDRYNQVKSQLVEENAIIVGRRKGGSVGLASVPGTKTLSVFVSYSHADEALKTELLEASRTTAPPKSYRRVA